MIILTTNNNSRYPYFTYNITVLNTYSYISYDNNNTGTISTQWPVIYAIIMLPIYLVTVMVGLYI